MCWHRPPNTLPPPPGDGALSTKHFVSRYPGRWPRVLGHSGAAGCVPRQGMVPGKEAAQDAAQPVQQAVLGPFTQQAGACLELAGSRACSAAQGSALCLGARTTVQAPGAGSLASQLDSNLAPRLPARTVQPHATAWGSCLQMGVHATAWEVPVLIPKSGSLLMQHHPGSPLAQPALQGIPSVAAGAAAEQALDGFGPSACGGDVGERQLWGEPISTVTEIQDHP